MYMVHTLLLEHLTKLTRAILYLQAMYCLSVLPSPRFSMLYFVTDVALRSRGIYHVFLYTDVESDSKIIPFMIPLKAICVFNMFNW